MQFCDFILGQQKSFAVKHIFYEEEFMQLNSYQALMRCLRITRTITRLSALSGISKSTLTLIAKGKGNYRSCLSTQLRLFDFFTHHENKVGRPKGGSKM